MNVELGEAEVSERTGLQLLYRPLILFLIVLIVGLALAWASSGSALQRIFTLSPSLLASLCGLALFHYLLRGLRWFILLRGARAPVGAWPAFVNYFGGLALVATPGRIGELVRLRWVHNRYMLPYRRLIPPAFADRALELASILIIIGACVALTLVGGWASMILLGIASLVVLFSLSPSMLRIVIHFIHATTGRKFGRRMVSGRRMVRSMEELLTPSLVIATILIGVAGWLFEGIAFWLLLGWLEQDIPLLIAVAIFLIGILSGAMMGLPGGLGGTEATIAGLLLLQGVSIDVALVATAVIRLATFWFALALGVLTFPYAEWIFRVEACVGSDDALR